MSTRRTLWEEGRRPGRQVVTLAGLLALACVGFNLLLTGELTFFYDLAFVGICVAAALTVRPRDFFAVGVFPPLLMLGVVGLLGLVAPGAVAEPIDSPVQAIVSGLAHHAGALIAGYGLTLGILALRQVAAKNEGRIRTPA